MSAGLGVVIVSAIMIVLFSVIAVLFPMGDAYDPHADPLFMQYHEPEYCPVCRDRRRAERKEP